MAKKVTLSDVAAAAGVSVGTASRALGATGRVSESTRERVRATAERLDFHPDALARSFVTGRSATVGVLAEQAVGLFSMPVIIGAAERLGEHGIATLMHNARATPADLAAHLKRLKARRVDALLVVGDTPDITDLAEALEFPAPMIFTNVEPTPSRRPVVTSDEHQAGVIAAEHLLGLGRTRIAHITASADLPAVARRAEGVVESLAQSGLQPVGGRPAYGSYSQAWGREAVRHLLDAGESFDGVVAGNDEIAIGAMAALADAGLRVPEDVAVVGHDNHQRHVLGTDLDLTSVDPRLVDVGRAAGDALLAAIAGEQLEPIVRVPGALAVGRSTVPDRSR
ncbi:LacI family transcriptional regulator [Microbacterium bovistercoris]|uniref:LacI family transcriptional regulator n=1 Tax=Microbacterium bovistercoris TaxID=2293570 RepID=A0A371NV64_9MICO|nr:LacI family DNA-binding transcriptional regulator [Microbacterium bovistercoris]REJ06468.1 LacI family transcriptional regulator [Microbacterium bovistercoris]